MFCEEEEAEAPLQVREGQRWQDFGNNRPGPPEPAAQKPEPDSLEPRRREIRENREAARRASPERAAGAASSLFPVCHQITSFVLGASVPIL